MQTFKQTLAILTLFSASIITTEPTYTPENTTVVIEPYNVDVKNSSRRILQAVVGYMASHPIKSLGILFTSEFREKIKAAKKAGKSLPEFIKILAEFDESGDIIAMAKRLNVSAKVELEGGKQFIKWLHDNKFKIICSSPHVKEDAELLKEKSLTYKLAQRIFSRVWGKEQEHFAQIKRDHPTNKHLLLAHKNQVIFDAARNAGYDVITYQDNDIAREQLKKLFGMEQQSNQVAAKA